MPNRRSRTDIHKGDRVRLEHSLDYGTVVSENADLITVKMDKESGHLTLRKSLFVPVIERKSAVNLSTTIFPVTLKDGKIHAAFVLDYRTDKWATMCGRSVPDPTAVEHKVTEVTCRKCSEALS